MGAEEEDLEDLVLHNSTVFLDLTSVTFNKNINNMI